MVCVSAPDRPGVLILGTLDTKGEAIAYVRRCVEERGLHPVVVDLGILGDPIGAADVTRQDVAVAGGEALESLAARGDKARAIETMTVGARRVVAQAYAEGRIAGALAVGGGQGAAMGTAALQTLPFGVPKLTVTTVASGRSVFEPYVGTSDMTLMHSVVDILGVDAISARILANAAGAICGMVDARSLPMPPKRALVGASMLGLTTEGVMAVRARLVAAGIDVVPFHANGTGGRCLEEFVTRGMLAGVLDISLQEIVGYLAHGLFDSGPDRLKAAGRVGVPQVVVPGGTDYLVLGPLASLTPEQRARPVVVHNPNITLVRTTVDEMSQVGRIVAERVNAATGPVAVVVPLGGFSQADRVGNAFFDRAADMALVEALRSDLRSDVRMLEVDAHVNDPDFARTVGDTMQELMQG